MRKLAPVVALAAASLLALPATPRGQQGQAAFRGGTTTVSIYATVINKEGRLVPDLEQEHFEVYDEGKKQEVTLFKSDVQPVSVIVMLDTSGSMTLNLDLLKMAAEQFVIRLLPADRARLGSFSDKIVINPPMFTSDRDELVRIVHENIEFGNPTFLWDAIARSMTALQKEQGRKVVLVFTDGEDDKSREYKFDELFTRAQSEDVMIYAVGLKNKFMGMETRPDKDLKRLALETGGGYFELTKATDLASTFTRVADELHRQYVIGFTPQNLDNRVHLLDVRVKVDGMTARARKSYLAAK
jgi:Ca-activated chloride channel homolog